MKILITGSTGLVGSACMDFFSKKGFIVYGIDANLRSQFFGTPEKRPYHLLDIRNRKEIFQLFEDERFDFVIHTAAQPSHDYSKHHVLEDFEINAHGTLNLLGASRKYGVKVFVHCSTDKIYGEGMMRNDLGENETRYMHPVPFNENTPVISPLSPFGVSKLCADYYAQEYASQGWLTTGIFRMGCITGKAHEGAEMHGFLAYLTKCIKEGTTYKIFGFKGKQVRDQIHAHDLASAFYQFIKRPRSGGVYNMGGGQERSVSVLEAGRMISDKLGKPFMYEIHEGRFGDRQWDVHDVSKFRKDYPAWEYKYSLDDIINDLCEK